MHCSISLACSIAPLWWLWNMSRVGDNIVPHQIKTPSELRPSHPHFCHIRCQACRVKSWKWSIILFSHLLEVGQIFKFSGIDFHYQHSWLSSGMQTNTLLDEETKYFTGRYLESWRISGEVLHYYETWKYLCLDRSHHNSLPWINILFRPTEAQQWNVWTEQLSISCCSQIKPGPDMFVSYVNYEVCCNVAHIY